MFFDTFRVWNHKAVQNTKQCCDLTFSLFVLCLPHGFCSPTCPSFPSAKIGLTLSGSCGVLCRWSLCVCSPTVYKACLSLMHILYSITRFTIVHRKEIQMTTQDVKEQIYSGYIASRDSWVVKPASAVTTREPAGLTSSPVLPFLCLPSLEIKCGLFLMHITQTNV